ncbi:Zinc resistance conferring protein [Entomophthora muscae]|uniref:Zinc resistance conferring protein n=1 Tax=Entomophthora muscae TaxID=34485 RepID=A0ACC2RXM1_9FUNG|nr:Zinc resistance conferring protein [Entomophthora muscae]
MLPDRSKLYIQLTLSIVLFLSELVVGYVANSIALVADAFHLLNDIASLIIAIYALRLASKEDYDPKYSYGMHRAETLGALINAVLLIGLCFTIFFEAIPRFFQPVEIDNPYLLLIIGTISLCFNIIGVFLFGEPRSAKHKHGVGSLNMYGVYLHVVGDALSSFAVVASALVVLLWEFPARYYFDPILSILITLVLLWMALPLIRRTSAILMQSAPIGIPVPLIEAAILDIDGIVGIHELHIWQLSRLNSVASMHVVIPQLKFAEFPTIATEIKTLLHAHNVHSVTIQPELHHSVLPLGACLLKCDKACSQSKSCTTTIKSQPYPYT